MRSGPERKGRKTPSHHASATFANAACWPRARRSVCRRVRPTVLRPAQTSKEGTDEETADAIGVRDARTGGERGRTGRALQLRQERQLSRLQDLQVGRD